MPPPKNYIEFKDLSERDTYVAGQGVIIQEFDYGNITKHRCGAIGMIGIIFIFFRTSIQI